MADEGMSLEERLGNTVTVEPTQPPRQVEVTGLSLEDRLRGGPPLHTSDLKTHITDIVDSMAGGARSLVDQVKRGVGIAVDEIYPKSAQEKIKGQAKDVVGTTGMLGDMAWNYATGQIFTDAVFAPGQAAVRQILGEGSTSYKSATEATSFEKVPWADPIKKMFKLMGEGSTYEESIGAKGMEKLSSAVEEGDKYMQEKYKWPPGAFTMQINQAMAIAPLVPKALKTEKGALALKTQAEKIRAENAADPYHGTDFVVGQEPGKAGQTAVPTSPFQQARSLDVIAEQQRQAKAKQDADAAEQGRLDRQRYGGVPTGTAVIPFQPDSPLSASLSSIPPSPSSPGAAGAPPKPRIRPKSQRGGMESPEEMAARYSDADLKEMGMTRAELVETLTDERPLDVGKLLATGIGVGALGVAAKRIYDYYNPEEPLDENIVPNQEGNVLSKGLPLLLSGLLPIMHDVPIAKRAAALEKAGKSREEIWKETQLAKISGPYWRTEVPYENLKVKLQPDAEGKALPGSLNPKQPMLMKDFIDWPEMFRMTPELADRPVHPILEHQSEGGARKGGYNPYMDDFIFAAAKPEDLRSAVVHEIQHYTDHWAGLPGGSTPREFLHPTFFKDLEAMEQALKDIERKYPEIDKVSDEVGYKSLAVGAEKLAAGRLEDLTPQERNAIRKIRGKEGAGEFLTQLMRMSDLHTQLGEAISKYERTQGEALARLVQRRMKLSPEERKLRGPWEDYDIPEKDITQPDAQGNYPGSNAERGIWDARKPADMEKALRQDALRDPEQGMVSPEMMNLLAGGSLGALGGMALSDPENRWIGAGIGAALGMGVASKAGQNIGRKSEIYQKAEKGFQGVIDDFFRRVNPDMLGKTAEGTSAVLASHYVDMMRRHIKEGVEGEERKKFFDGLSEAEHKQFIKGLEMGVKFKDPTWQKYAADYNKMALEIAQRDAALGIKYDPLDHYIFHIFDEPGAAQAYLQNKYGKGWDVDINKKAARYLLDLENAGFKLTKTNPEEIMRARLYSSDIAKLKVDALQQLADFGIAREKTKGSFIQSGETKWTSPNGKEYYLPDQANQVFHNAFDTRSLWDDTGAAGMTYRGAMWMKNTIVPWKLFSLFHPLHVELGMNSGTQGVNAIKAWAAGNKGMGEALFDVARPMVLPYDAIGRLRFLSREMHPDAMKAMRGDLDPAKLTPEIQRQVQLALDGGFTPEMSAEYKNQHIKAFRDAMRDGYGQLAARLGGGAAGGAGLAYLMSGDENRDRNVGLAALGGAAAMISLPFAMLEKVWTRPVFENWIPAMKWEAYQKSALTHMAANPDLASQPLERMMALRKISKMIDDRFGEMQYKTLFMDRMVKDIAVASFLSYGWQYGFARSYLGAFPEAAKAFTKDETLSGRGTLKERIAKGELDKTLFLGNYLAATMFYGGLMTYALTGEAPREILDYIYPRNGDKNPDGTDSRLSTPFYTREFVSIPKHMQEEGAVKGLGIVAANKLSPALGLANGIISNKDFFNREISDPNADFWPRMGQKFAYAMGEMEPISSSAPRRSGKMEPLDYALAGLGFSPAPKYVTESPADALIHQYLRYHRPATTPYEKAQRGQEMYQLYRLKQEGKHQEFEDQLTEVKQKYNLNQQAVDRIRKEAVIPTVFRQFKILSESEQRRVLERMDPEDQKRFKPYARRVVKEEMERR